MLKEFKEFAMKGNMIDLAVGVVIGTAFGTAVKSLVDDILMPLVSGIFSLPDFSNLYFVLKNPAGVDFTTVQAAKDAGASVLSYGLFINAFIAFLLVAIALFFVIKGINKLKKKEEPAIVHPTELEVLKEIRDSLKK
jgi:large conductance mechanosensitive channel